MRPGRPSGASGRKTRSAGSSCYITSKFHSNKYKHGNDPRFSTCTHLGSAATTGLAWDRTTTFILPASTATLFQQGLNMGHLVGSNGLRIHSTRIISSALRAFESSRAPRPAPRPLPGTSSGPSCRGSACRRSHLRSHAWLVCARCLARTRFSSPMRSMQRFWLERRRWTQPSPTHPLQRRKRAVAIRPVPWPARTGNSPRLRQAWHMCLLFRNRAGKRWDSASSPRGRRGACHLRALHTHKRTRVRGSGLPTRGTGRSPVVLREDALGDAGQLPGCGRRRVQVAEAQETKDARHGTLGQTQDIKLAGAFPLHALELGGRCASGEKSDSARDPNGKVNCR